MQIPKDAEFKILVTDTAINHTIFNEIDFSNQRCIDLNLPLIHQGVDSFELRIWVNSMMNPSPVIILRYADDKWVAQKYYYFKQNDIIDSIQIYNMTVPNEIEHLISFLEKPDVLNLPSQQAIPNFQDNIAHGQTCTIEIATKKYYKGLQYHCPEHFTRDEYHIKFMKILNLLNSHFHFYYPWCKPGE